MHHRRLARDYEARPDNSARMITIAVIDNLAKRVTGETSGLRPPSPGRELWRNMTREVSTDREVPTL